MYKKITLFLVSTVFLCSFNIAKAGVIINEVQLSPTDARFIELYNQDNTEIDLTDWYIQRKTSGGSSFGSLVTKTYFENKKIGPKDFFVISKIFLNNSDIAVDNLTLTESNTIQLKNQNGDVVDKIGWGDSSDCDGICPVNPNEGKSLQLVNNSWVVSAPTVGISNDINNVDENNTNSNIVSVSNETNTDKKNIDKTKIIEIPKMKLNILLNDIVFAEQATLFQSSVFGYKNEKIVLGKLYWNFGDGTSLEQINKFDKFYKTYFYPGEYSVSLEYYPNNFTDSPEIVDKIKVKVVPLTVSISKVRDISDFFIELTNNSSYDVDISKWTLATLDKIFVFPKNTFILAKNKVIISSKTTGFVVADRYNLKLIMPNGEVVYRYNDKNTEGLVNKNDNKITKSEGRINNIENIDLDEEKSNLELEASAIDSSQNLIDNKINFAFIFGLVILLGVAGSLVYFLRQKKNIKKVGDDFEILDE